MGIEKSQRIGVLMGGLSAEHDVSIKSGKAVLAALLERGWDAVAVMVDSELPVTLREQGIEVAWLALHGQFGEDGCVQGLLELMRIPYTGSGVLASATAMDKITTKRLLQDTVIPMPQDRVWRGGDPFPEAVRLPVVAKFPEGGSTLGLAICHDAGDLEKALLDLSKLGGQVLLEQFVTGMEITVAVLDGHAFPSVGIVPASGTFDYEAKYVEGKTVYQVPAQVSSDVDRAARQYALVAYETLGLNGVARADFIVDAEGVPWFLEINTLPGMTSTSLSPMAASLEGMDFASLVEAILAGARCEKQPAKGSKDP
jgi:D-alanine-D-alanine ligase